MRFASSDLRAALVRIHAMFVKELIQLRRDRVTLAMIVGIPFIQLLLFGYAINADPKHLPTALLAQDDGPLARSFVAALRATDYFDIVAAARDEADADRLILSNKVQFVVDIPPDFGRRLVRGEHPPLLVIADATDPTATSGAVAAVNGAAASALSRELTGPLAHLAQGPPPYELRVHRRYNPAGETRRNIVPGLIGTILTMTMLIYTALSVTREIERGTMEALLAMPVRPTEIMLGKIAPYVVVGGVQMAIILLVATLLFHVPIVGSLLLLGPLTLLFITANLSVGYTFSTIAVNQLQAIQMTFFFFLPNMLLSGFLFPFRGMPLWAQYVGEALPLTHYLRIVRSIMLKGSGFFDLTADTLALGLFTLAAMGLAILRFRQTLD
ncbi:MULTISPECIES: ABC transporter permease [Methylosinus]|uniref:ABC transporter permease n=1 Tax=Methylosinus trichosporium (strain ATCC 35070 / NCIMB 11131 / UNIQEM 75 / OB3b) TaxID=595536 RepID=A0A2D2CXP2_METT3|nr:MULTISPECIES: ABC transporter permease [Methylosinus]ATQ67488.1 ABC transporter permease [Methylosinus trichosporium OB3b]OBS51540.1 mannose-1-phosphate guanyltransferase [Methylosinus sp. 3S-1]